MTKEKNIIKLTATRIGVRVSYVDRIVMYDHMLRSMIEKKQRNIYNPNAVYGFCFFIPNASYYRFEYPLDKLVELYAYHPIRNEDHSYWFDRFDADCRIKILQTIIKDMSSTLTVSETIYLSLAKKYNLSFTND